MKQINLLLIILVLLVGCRSTKKVIKSDVQTNIQTETKQTTASKEKQNIDFDKNSNQETTNINIKFSPPDKNLPQTDRINTGIPEVDEQLKNQNLGDHGPVESISITTTKSNESDKSKVTTEKEDQSTTNTKAKDQSTENTVTKEKTKPDRRWMWFLIIPAAAVGFLIYRKWAWIQSVLSKFSGKSKI